MADKRNLLKGNEPTQFRSGREAVENGRKGGIASGESRRAKKSMSELAMKKNISEKQGVYRHQMIICRDGS